LTGFIDQKDVEEVADFKLSEYENPACTVNQFTTVWAPVRPVAIALSRQYPVLTFKHTYEERGLLSSGYKVWKAGNLLNGDENESNDLEQEDDYEE